MLISQAAGKLRPLEGMSTTPVLPKDIPHMPHNDYHPITDHLNFAESEGAVHRGSLVEQWGCCKSHIENTKRLGFSKWRQKS